MATGIPPGSRQDSRREPGSRRDPGRTLVFPPVSHRVLWRFFFPGGIPPRFPAGAGIPLRPRRDGIYPGGAQGSPPGFMAGIFSRVGSRQDSWWIPGYLQDSGGAADFPLGIPAGIFPRQDCGKNLTKNYLLAGIPPRKKNFTELRKGIIFVVFSMRTDLCREESLACVDALENKERT